MDFPSLRLTEPTKTHYHVKSVVSILQAMGSLLIEKNTKISPKVNDQGQMPPKCNYFRVHHNTYWYQVTSFTDQLCFSFVCRHTHAQTDRQTHGRDWKQYHTAELVRSHWGLQLLKLTQRVSLRETALCFVKSKAYYQLNACFTGLLTKMGNKVELEHIRESLGYV